MLLTTFALSAGLLFAQGQPVKLNRIFTKGEKLEYDLKSTLNSETRLRGLETWIPEDFDIQYKFKIEVLELKADGFADVKYLRPTVTEIEGETADSPPKTKVEKTNMDLLLTLSPVNGITKIKDMSKKEEPKKPETKKPPVSLLLGSSAWGGPGPQNPALAMLGQFVGEIYRLSLFLGPLDSSLDFSPKLPFDEVKPGDTWKKTVGYSPQKLQGKGGKLAVQRLDYLYTYVGLVQSQGKSVQRIKAELEVNSDLAEFVHQTFDVKASETGLKEIPLHFKGEVEFDLDPKTLKTLRAVGTSKGGFKIVLTNFPNEPIQEENIKGRTILKLLNP